MKKYFCISIVMLAAEMAYSQISCEVALRSLSGTVNCDESYELAFEDNFDGNSLDANKWTAVTGVARDFNFVLQKAWHQPENIEVNNGTCKIIGKKLSTPYTGTYWTPQGTQTSTFDYSTGEMSTNERFSYGKYEARCRLPDGKGFWPAFWIFGGPIYSEIDFFEIFGDNIDKYTCNVHYDFDHDNTPEQCYFEQENVCDFTQWHTFTCIFDLDRIVWQIDGVTIRTYYRYYTTDMTSPVLCPSSGTYFVQKAFPTENMSIILNLAIQSGSSSPDANTIFPGTFEIDYVRYYKKAESPCEGCLDHIAYENTNHIPLLTRADNFIDAGTNSVVSNGQNVNFKAPAINLTSEFSVDPEAIFNATSEECDFQNATDVPLQLIETNAIDNYQVIKCVNPIYTIEASGALYCSIRITSLQGQDVYVVSGMPASNFIASWNSISAAEGWYHVILEMSNCTDYYFSQFDIFVSNGNCRVAGIDTLNNRMDSTGSGALGNQELEGFYIYPNPGDENINVSCLSDSSTTARVFIYDLFGRELNIYKEQIVSGKNNISIPTSQLANGSYILRLDVADKTSHGAFIISR